MLLGRLDIVRGFARRSIEFLSIGFRSRPATVSVDGRHVKSGCRETHTLHKNMEKNQPKVTT